MIPLFKPHIPDLPELYKVLNSGKLSYGDLGMKFEEELGAYIGNSQVVTVNNFNMAILVSMAVLDIGFNDEVIVSPMSCLVSTQPLASLGIKVIWADVDPLTGTLDPESVSEKITSKTKAIVHNHYCGHVGHIDEINEIGYLNGIPIIDDGIEAFGSEYKGKKLGNCGSDITIFSFNAVRIPNTIEGGAIVFKDNSLFEKSKLVRDSGINRKYFRDDLNEISASADVSLIGYDAKMSELNSYIGIEQLKKIDELISKQRKNAIGWNNFLDKDDNIKKVYNKNSTPNYWVYGVLAANKKETILKYREKGFYVSGVHINNNIYSVFKNNSQLKGVNEFYNKFVAFPSGWWMEISENGKL